MSAPTAYGRSFNRASILRRLRAALAEGRPIVAVAAGSGIVAKCAEVAGVDLILVLCTGRSRSAGIPTTVTLGNANTMTLDAFREIDNVVEKTPIIAGAEATDPTRWRKDKLVKEFLDAGFDGIGNFPSIAAAAAWGAARSDVGNGIERDYEVIRIARQQDIFTIGFAFSPEQAKGVAEAGADVLVARCGLTVGGLSGPRVSPMTFEEAADYIQQCITAARQAKPDIMCLATGGPFATPDDTDYLYAHTDAQGFLGESAIERIPVEEGVAAVTRDYKAATLRPSAMSR